MGAWIEIKKEGEGSIYSLVASLVGAWIEICIRLVNTYYIMSLPLWERGLKLMYSSFHFLPDQRRFPCGSVD